MNPIYIDLTFSSLCTVLVNVMKLDKNKNILNFFEKDVSEKSKNLYVKRFKGLRSMDFRKLFLLWVTLLYKEK